MKYFIFTIVFMSFPLVAETIKEKAENDEVTFVKKDDPHMLKAFEKAKGTLHSFFTIYKDTASKQNYYLKVGIRDGEDVEYFWVGDFRVLSDNSFSGEINNQPRLVRNVKLGETIQFSKADVYDWMYLENNKMHGNFTACAMLVHESAEQQEEFKKAYGLECEI